MDRFFSHRYAQARERFLVEAQMAGAEQQSITHPLPGRDGEVLALDVARLGPADATRRLIVSSGCHGVEGPAGGAVQLALLAEAAPLREALEGRRVRLLLLHALNPWGWSHDRRQDHENIDLNRNFIDFEAVVPHNPGYDDLAALLVPGRWPPPASGEAQFFARIAERGERAVQQVVSAGQYDHPGGLFYGGRAPSWGRLALQALLEAELRGVEECRWVDLHTGLGPRGSGERIHAGPETPEALARARAVWGPSITSTADGSSVSALLHGELQPWFASRHPGLRFAGLTLEFGTVPLLAVVQALRGEAWLRHHGDAPTPLREAIDSALRDAFAPADGQWRDDVLRQGLDVLQQALHAPWGR
jgi:hypothetical protein